MITEQNARDVLVKAYGYKEVDEALVKNGASDKTLITMSEAVELSEDQPSRSTISRHSDNFGLSMVVDNKKTWIIFKEQFLEWMEVWKERNKNRLKAKPSKRNPNWYQTLGFTEEAIYPDTSGVGAIFVDEVFSGNEMIAKMAEFLGIEVKVLSLDELPLPKMRASRAGRVLWVTNITLVGDRKIQTWKPPTKKEDGSTTVPLTQLVKVAIIETLNDR